MRGGRMPAGSAMSSTRRRISPAALFVNVTASTRRGCTPSTPRSQAMRWAMTRVLPLPAPASTRTGPLVAWTASRWTGLSGARIASGATAGRSMSSYDITPRRRTGPALLDGDGLGEIPRLVDVATEPDGHVIGEELKRNGHENGRQELGRGGHRHDTRGARPDLAIARVCEGDDPPVPGPHFLHGIHHPFVGRIPRREGDHRHAVVDEGDGPVLHLAGRVAFRVEVRQLLELERAFERDWIVDAPPEEEKVLVSGHLLG